MKSFKIIKIGVFWGCVAGISLWGMIQKDRSFSPNENRYLETVPEFSVSTFMDGSFQEKLEDYLNDQIVGRDLWITIKTAIQKGVGNTNIGGAYIGKNGYDFEKILPEQVDESLIARNTQAIQKFFDSCVEQGLPKEQLSFLLVPTSGMILADQLPEHARIFDQKACMQTIKEGLSSYNIVDATLPLFQAAKEQQVFYKTDHHWTTDGAFAVYQDWCTQTGKAVKEKEDYIRRKVTNSFRGSLYSKVLDADSAYDAMYAYMPIEPLPYEVTIRDKTSNSVFDASRLQEKDKYAYFFGGNYTEVLIRTINFQQTNDSMAQTSANTSLSAGANSTVLADLVTKQKNAQKNLLVIKDSFANSFVPFMVNDYDEIRMLDLRYFKGNVQEYIKEHAISEVLVLYNVSNFITDKNIARLR